MTKKEFNIAGYKEVMANFLGDPEGKDKVFFEALDFAVQAHTGQWRKSGDSYILHPCNVTRILAEEMEIRDPEILAAALLSNSGSCCRACPIRRRWRTCASWLFRGRLSRRR